LKSERIDVVIKQNELALKKPIRAFVTFQTVEGPAACIRIMQKRSERHFLPEEQAEQEATQN
jgi:hypothetical protein